MTPDQYCQDKAAKSGSSAYYSVLFLPPDRRRAVTALYAFCREVGDVADECADSQVARAKLGWWRDEVARLFRNEAQHPVGQALAPVVRAFDLPEERFHEIVDGMEMDIDQNRYLDFKALQLYCYRVASVAGQMAAEVLGYRDRRTLKYAHDLGMAFRLTGIIRDAGEDARRGRIYFPLDELRAHGVGVADLLHYRESDNFRKLMEFQAERARHYFDQALAALPEEDRRSQRPGLVTAALCRALLEEIRRDGYRVLTQRTALTPLRKLWIAWRTWGKG